MIKRMGAGGFRAAVQRTMVEVALRGEGYAKGNAATVLNVRTGHLRRSIAGTVRDTPEGPEAVISAGGTRIDRAIYDVLPKVGSYSLGTNPPNVTVRSRASAAVCGSSRPAVSWSCPSRC